MCSSDLRPAQDFSKTKIEALKVRDNIYMLVGEGGNITVQIGNDGVLIVDTQYEPLADRILAKIRELSKGPIRYIIDTHHHGDHTGGNARLRAAGFSVSGGNVGGDIADAGTGAQTAPQALRGAGQRLVQRLHHGLRQGRSSGRVQETQVLLDRKSTRLNSSH